MTIAQMYQASKQQLTRAIQSVLGHYWYMRLRGYEIDTIEFSRKSYEHSYVLPQALSDKQAVLRILCKLVEKLGTRIRRDDYSARGIWSGLSALCLHRYLSVKQRLFFFFCT